MNKIFKLAARSVRAASAMPPYAAPFRMGSVQACGSSASVQASLLPRAIVAAGLHARNLCATSAAAEGQKASTTSSWGNKSNVSFNRAGGKSSGGPRRGGPSGRGGSAQARQSAFGGAGGAISTDGLGGAVRRRKGKGKRGDGPKKPKARAARRDPLLVGTYMPTTKILTQKRTVKVTKGGKNSTIQATVVCGNQQGCVGAGLGKGPNNFTAVKRAIRDAHRNQRWIDGMFHRTIAHDSVAKVASTNVRIMPAKPGNGIRAGNVMKGVLEATGVKDCVAKVHGSNHPYNTAKATIDAMAAVASPRYMALARGKKLVISRSSSAAKAMVKGM